jgi:hypothetical protein
MTVQTVVPDAPASRPSSGPQPHRAIARRALIIGLAPVIAYAVVRPLVGSDALGLAIAGAIPLIYAFGRAPSRHRIDSVAIVVSIGYALGCIASLLTGGNSLPLKLHEAAITFAIGLVLLIAVLIRRPIPVTRWLRVPPTEQLDSTLGIMLGGFLLLHALLHLALAVSLSTASYLVMSRVVNWATLAVGMLCLSAYLRRIRTTSLT